MNTNDRTNHPSAHIVRAAVTPRPATDPVNQPHGGPLRLVESQPATYCTARVAVTAIAVGDVLLGEDDRTARIVAITWASDGHVRIEGCYDVGYYNQTFHNDDHCVRVLCDANGQPRTMSQTETDAYEASATSASTVTSPSEIAALRDEVAALRLEISDLRRAMERG